MPTVPRPFTGTAGGKFGVQVFGGQNVIARIKKYAINTQSAMYTAMNVSLLEVEGEAKRLIASGYYRPAIDTGRMRNSVNGQITSFTKALIIGVVGTAVYYAIYVHEGVHKTAGEISFDSMMDTYSGIWRMAPRPFMIDALENKQEKIQNNFKRAMQKDLGTGA